MILVRKNEFWFNYPFLFSIKSKITFIQIHLNQSTVNFTFLKSDYIGVFNMRD